MDRGKEEVAGVSEAGIADNFAGPQQCTMMNAFDLLQPTIKRQLESGTGIVYAAGQICPIFTLTMIMSCGYRTWLTNGHV